jgi:hypothetical protein
MMACASAVVAAETPRPSPELTIQRNGAPLKLSQFRGKIIALAFTHLSCKYCQDLTRTLKVIQKDYEGRNVQVVECAFDAEASGTLGMFSNVLQPNFPVGYTTDAIVKKYLKWDDEKDGNLYVPYMVFIDSNFVIQGDYSGKDGFFTRPDPRIRAVLDQMVNTSAAKKK